MSLRHKTEEVGGRVLKQVLFLLMLFPIALHSAKLASFPMGSIQGPNTRIQQAEGIAFSPDRKYVAIASASNGKVLLYSILDCNSLKNDIAPVFILESPQNPLNFPHDVAFSPNGEHLAVASRNTNEVVIYQKNKDDDFFSQIPFFIIKGSDASFVGMNAVAFHPSGKCLAVCDVLGHHVALYYCDGDTYTSMPYQVITGPIDIFSRPDGIAFSSDGSLLAITSHGVHSVLIYERIAETDDRYTEEPVEIIKGEETGFHYTHSVSFHPRDDTLAVSSAAGRKTLSLFKKISNTAPRYNHVPVQTFAIYNPETIYLQQHAEEEGGVKGIAFSCDGTILGICAADLADPAKSIVFYPVIPGVFSKHKSKLSGIIF